MTARYLSFLFLCSTKSALLNFDDCSHNWLDRLQSPLGSPATLVRTQGLHEWNSFYFLHNSSLWFGCRQRDGALCQILSASRCLAHHQVRTFNTRATHTHAHSRRAHASERSTSGATADEHNPLWSAEEYRAVQEAEELKRKVYVLFTISWYLPSFMADSAHQA